MPEATQVCKEQACRHLVCLLTTPYMEAVHTCRRQNVRAHRAIAVPDWVAAPWPPLVQASHSPALALEFSNVSLQTLHKLHPF